jgi:hypothetical protein
MLDGLNLLNDITARAQGVFLWMKLVSMILVRAHRGGASFATLRRLVSDFPQELEEFYTRIIRELPQSRRFETFAMIEVVLRTERTLSVEDLMGAMRCAPCETLNECFANGAMQSSSPTVLEKTIRHIRDYTGGLLEVLVITEGPIVQFMHQTVKGFHQQTRIHASTAWFRN